MLVCPAVVFRRMPHLGAMFAIVPELSCAVLSTEYFCGDSHRHYNLSSMSSLWLDCDVLGCEWMSSCTIVAADLHQCFDEIQLTSEPAENSSSAYSPGVTMPQDAECHSDSFETQDVDLLCVHFHVTIDALRDCCLHKLFCTYCRTYSHWTSRSNVSEDTMCNDIASNPDLQGSTTGCRSRHVKCTSTANESATHRSPCQWIKSIGGGRRSWNSREVVS